MGHHAVVIPTKFWIGSGGGPGFYSNILETDSGQVTVIRRRQQARWKFNLDFDARKGDFCAELIRFHLARGGAATRSCIAIGSTTTARSSGTRGRISLDRTRPTPERQWRTPINSSVPVTVRRLSSSSSSGTKTGTATRTPRRSASRSRERSLSRWMAWGKRPDGPSIRLPARYVLSRADLWCRGDRGVRVLYFEVRFDRSADEQLSAIAANKYMQVSGRSRSTKNSSATLLTRTYIKVERLISPSRRTSR